jgi:hypothetical protein
LKDEYSLQKWDIYLSNQHKSSKKGWYMLAGKNLFLCHRISLI